MRLLERGQRMLAEPDDAMLSKLYRQLRDIHSGAYDWDAPEIDMGALPVGTEEDPVFREKVDKTSGDLRRLYPESEPDIEETALEFSLSGRPAPGEAHSRMIRNRPAPMENEGSS